MTKTDSGQMPGLDNFETRWVDGLADGASTSPRACLHVAGELDSISAPLLLGAWDGEVGTLLDHIRVDLGRVTFCNAAGLHALDTIRASCGERGLALTLVVQPRLAWLIRVVASSVDDVAELEILPRISTHLADGLDGAVAGDRSVGKSRPHLGTRW